MSNANKAEKVVQETVDYMAQMVWRFDQHQRYEMSARQLVQLITTIAFKAIAATKPTGPCCEGSRRLESTPGDATTLRGWWCPDHGTTIRV